MKVRLSVQHQKANVKTVVLHSNAVIGRSTECNLRLASGQVSRQHCQLLIDDQRVAIVDLGSSNGTFLNGQQLTANVETPLPSGAELEIGPVKFTVEYDDPNADTSIRKSPPEQIVVTPDMNTPPVNQMMLDQASAELEEGEDEPEAVAETEFADPRPPKDISLLKLNKKPAALHPIAPRTGDDNQDEADADESSAAAATAGDADDEEIDSRDERFNEATLSDVTAESLQAEADDADGDPGTLYDTHAEFELDEAEESAADEAPDDGEEFAPQVDEPERPAQPSDDDFMKFLQNLDD